MVSTAPHTERSAYKREPLLTVAGLAQASRPNEASLRSTTSAILQGRSNNVFHSCIAHREEPQEWRRRSKPKTGEMVAFVAQATALASGTCTGILCIQRPTTTISSNIPRKHYQTDWPAVAVPVIVGNGLYIQQGECSEVMFADRGRQRSPTRLEVRGVGGVWVRVGLQGDLRKCPQMW